MLEVEVPIAHEFGSTDNGRIQGVYAAGVDAKEVDDMVAKLRSRS